ncbi:MAG: ABC transporter permease [Planctomycetes bacterium]|nr:ABC transporter permease [Planctomycetota bacterium]
MLNPLFYLQAIYLALSQIWANKLRSILTTLGIIFGVWAVTTVVAAISGVTTMVLAEFESLGGSKMFIFPDRPDDAPRNKYPWEMIRLKPEELVALATHCPSVIGITPQTTFGASIQHGERQRDGVSVTGIWPDWHDIERRTTLIGRPFAGIDEDNARQVCLVNEAAISELGLDTDPTGEHILINTRRFLVIGVVENKQESIFDRDTTGTEVFIPFATAVKLQSPEFFFMITMKLKGPEVVEEAKAEAKFVLRQARKLGPDDPNTFEIFAADEFIEGIQKVAGIMTVGGACVVAVSLLVGGIGIMNIMLVSVSERTREIGLRKAVGATPAAVLMQFLLEAVTLCIAGGLIGIAAGEATSFALSVIPGIGLSQAAVPWWAIVMSFSFCAVIGVVFGMFPAIKAARLDPIEALRHE